MGPSPSSLPSPSLLPPARYEAICPPAHIQARHHHYTAFNSVVFYKTEYFLFANAPLNETNLMQSRPYIWGSVQALKLHSSVIVSTSRWHVVSRLASLFNFERKLHLDSGQIGRNISFDSDDQKTQAMHH